MSDVNEFSKSDYQRGAALAVLALAVAIFMLMATVIVTVGSEASSRGQAQSAADAVALAGAAGGIGEAERMALKYGADLLVFSIDGSTVSVVLLLDGIRSSAYAERHLVATGRG